MFWLGENAVLTGVDWEASQSNQVSQNPAARFECVTRLLLAWANDTTPTLARAAYINPDRS